MGTWIFIDILCLFSLLGLCMCDRVGKEFLGERGGLSRGGLGGSEGSSLEFCLFSLFCLECVVFLFCAHSSIYN